jgi:iron complex transport system substrate-binding protein
LSVPRVISLLPAATEIVAELGGQDSLVGISHECDYPPSIRHLPRVTSSPIDPLASSGAIDRAVSMLRRDGVPVIGVNEQQLRELAPDLILTQGLCDVCAVADGAVHRLAHALDPMPRIISLNASNLDGIFTDIRTVADGLDLIPEAVELIAGLRYRLERLRRDAPTERRRVLAVEWLDPVYLAGHWVPELVELAGGTGVGARPGDRSRRIAREELGSFHPDVVVVMLCGFTLERSQVELARHPLPELGAPVWALDGSAFTSRAGPRVVEGAGLLQSALRGETRPGLVRIA